VFRLDGKTAIVTGGGSGIGREISLRFAAQGAVVAVADVNMDGANTVADEITAAGGKAYAQKLDVSSQAAADEAVAEIVRRHGRLDILVNNAGIGFVGNALETGDDDLDKLYAVNVKGVFHCSKAAVAQMLAQEPKGGRIVNIGSVAGMVSVARRFAYCATKGAVLSMTQSLAMDFIDQGIRCNSISPGTIESPFVESYLQRFHAGEIEETRAQLHARQPIGRMGRPDEIAPLALYLVSDESGFVTGANYVIDGGLTAR
jgi:NAD(P)-dependent dehydrogenase (short-subunit alcohol dehydrogenase family)